MIKVADFGISGVTSFFNTNVKFGTLQYMPPEIISGKEKGFSPAADVWACGIILYILLFGFNPF